MKTILTLERLSQKLDLKTQTGEALRERIVQLVGKRGALAHQRQITRLLVQPGFCDGHTQMLSNA